MKKQFSILVLTLLFTLFLSLPALADNALYGNTGTLSTSSGYIQLSFPTVTVGNHYRYLLDVTFADHINVSSLVFGGSSAYRFGVTSVAMQDIITVAGQRVIVDVTFQHVYGGNSQFAIRPSSGSLVEGDDYIVNTYGFVPADTNYSNSGKMMVYDNIISNWTYLNNINTYETIINADTKSTTYKVTDTNTTYTLQNYTGTPSLMPSDHSSTTKVVDTNTTYSTLSLLNSNLVTDNSFIWTTVSSPIHSIKIGNVVTYAGTVLRSASSQTLTMQPTSGSLHRLSCRPLDFTVNIVSKGLNPANVTMSGLDGLTVKDWNYSDNTIMISGQLPTYEPDSGAYYEYTEVDLSDLVITITNDSQRLPLFFTVESFIVDATGDGTDTGILLGIKNKLDNLGSYFVTQIQSTLHLGTADTVTDDNNDKADTTVSTVTESLEAEDAITSTASQYITAFSPDASSFASLAVTFAVVDDLFTNLFNAFGDFGNLYLMALTLGLVGFVLGFIKSKS